MAGDKASRCIGRWDGGSSDCNLNGLDDAQDIADETSLDCNGNGLPDECDLAAWAGDANGNDIPDDCEPDCNHNGVPDAHDIFLGNSLDGNFDGIPDDCSVVAVLPEPERPARTRLLGPAAHPVRTRTSIAFEVERSGDAVLTLHDLAGRLVHTWTLAALPAGTHAVVWEGRDARGADVPGGIYFLRLASGGAADAMKIVRIR
jgi:hypothetical protein